MHAYVHVCMHITCNAHVCMHVYVCACVHIMCVNMCIVHCARAVSSVDYSVHIYSVSVCSVTASSRGACPRHAVALQPRTDGDVTLKVTATSALDGDPRGLGPDGRGTDDNARYLHQVGHVVRLPRRRRGVRG